MTKQQLRKLIEKLTVPYGSLGQCIPDTKFENLINEISIVFNGK